MRRSTALRLLLWLLVVATMAPGLADLARPLAWGSQPDPARLVKGALGSLPGILLVLAIGRTLLSVLPPGRLGSHAASELPATWAASHLLGGLAIDLVGRLAGFADLPALEVVLVATAVALWVRWLTLPGAPVPGAPALRGVAGAVGAAALVLLVALVSLPALLWASPAVAARAPSLSSPTLELAASVAPERFAEEALPAAWVNMVALFALLAHGLSGAVPSRAARRMALALLAAAPALVLAVRRDPELSFLVLRAGAGAAFAVHWMRRADRRSGWVAVLAWGGLGLAGPSGVLLGLVGTGVLVLFGKGARLFAASAGVVSAALFATPLVLQRDFVPYVKETTWDLIAGLRDAPHASLGSAGLAAGRAASNLASWGLAWPVAALVLVVFAVRRFRRGQPDRQPAEATPAGREVLALAAWTVAALALHLVLSAWATPESSWAPRADTGLALVVLAPAALLATALALLPRDVPGSTHTGTHEA